MIPCFGRYNNSSSKISRVSLNDNSLQARHRSPRTEATDSPMPALMITASLLSQTSIIWCQFLSGEGGQQLRRHQWQHYHHNFLLLCLKALKILVQLYQIHYAQSWEAVKCPPKIHEYLRILFVEYKLSKLWQKIWSNTKKSNLRHCTRTQCTAQCLVTS